MPDSILHFSPNVPITLCIADPEGSWDHEIQQGMYQTTTGKTFVLPRPAVVTLNELEPRPGEEIQITRHWKGRTSDPVRWTICLTAKSEKARAAEEIGQNEATDPQDLTAERGTNLLNRSDGGEGNPGYVFTPEVRRQIGLKSKGHTLSPEHKAKLLTASRAANLGRRWTPQQKKLQSDQRIGIPRPAHVIARFHANNKGRSVSVEVRAKLSAFHTGLKASPETRAKMSVSGKRVYAQRLKDGETEWMKLGRIARWKKP